MLCHWILYSDQLWFPLQYFKSDDPEPHTHFDAFTVMCRFGFEGLQCWPDLWIFLQASCFNLNVYLQSSLSQYLLNVSTAAELCSQTLCGSHGRCLRKNPDSDVYLHLNPLTHSIKNQMGKPTVTGELDEAEKTRFQTEFQCQCYRDYEGEVCEQRGAPSQARNLSALQSVVLMIISLLLSFIF